MFHFVCLLVKENAYRRKSGNLDQRDGVKSQRFEDCKYNRLGH